MKRALFSIGLIILLTATLVRAEEPPTLTLQQAINNALQNLPEIRAAQGGFQAAKAGEEFARSNYYPDVHFFAEDLAGTNNQTRSSYLSLPGIPRTGQPGRSWDASNNFLGGFVVNQVLYDFGRRSSQLKTSGAGARAAGYTLEVARQEAILNVKEAYFAYLAIQRLIAADQASVSKLEKTLEMTQEGYGIGLRPKIDVSTAKTNLIDAQTVLVRAVGQLKNAKASLDHAMGLETNRSYKVEDILAYAEPSGSLENFQRQAYEQRPDLKERLAQEEGARGEVEGARSNYFPFLVGSGSVNARGADFPLTSNWDAAVILDFPLDWFRVRHQVDGAKAHLTQVREQTEAARQKVALEVEEAYNDVQSARQRIPLAEQNLTEAKERLEIAEGRYKGGVGNIIEFIDAQTFLAGAETGYIRTLYDYNQAVAHLELAVGGSLTK